MTRTDTKSGRARDLDPSGFIEILREESLDKGFGIVPLVGAGLSAASGVPIITEVRQYLHRCLARALGLDLPQAWRPDTASAHVQTGLTTLDLSRFRRWLPARDSWPPFSSPQGFERDTVDWMDRLDRVLSEMRADSRRNPDAYLPELCVFQEAFGAAAEWRSLLQFIARLRTLPETESLAPESRHQLVLGPPNPDIIDTFFLNVVEGKRPTLAHRMLARLAGQLRIETILTTNFDDLLEQAFAETENPFTTFDVHMSTGLPPYRDLEGRNSIVKLHGGRYGLRADYSLDLAPTDEDLRHFVSYLVDRHLSDQEWYEARCARKLGPQRHLLVSGLSAGDERINAMLRVAADTLDEQFRVYWIAYRDRDVERAGALLGQLFPETPDQYRIVRHQFAGLMFLHAHQFLVHAPPPSRAPFPTAARLPVPPELTAASDGHGDSEANDARGESEGGNEIGETPTGSEDELLDAQKTQICARVAECMASTNHPDPVTRLVLMHAPRNRYFGLSTSAARAFDQLLDDGRQCVWIDLDEVSSGNDLFEVLLHSIARRAGVVDWMPVLAHSESETDRDRVRQAQVREIERLTNNPNRRWVVFLNGRSGTGVNTLPVDEYETDRRDFPNGWLDRDPEDERRTGFDEDWDSTANGEYVVELLRALCGDDCPNLTVVFLCFEGSSTGEAGESGEAVPAKSGFLERVRDSLPHVPDPIAVTENAFDSEYGNDLSTESLVKRAMEWCDDVPKKTLNKLNRTRSEEEVEEILSKEKSNRTRFLHSLVLFNRTRYECSLWRTTFHPDDLPTRKRSKAAATWIKELEEKHVLRRKRGGFVWMHCDIRNGLRERLGEEDSGCRRFEAEIHHGHAEWYHELFLASDDTDAAFELVYHRCKQSEALLEDEQDEGAWTARASVVVQVLRESRLVLEQARHSMLVSGYSKGLCRRLQLIRADLLNSVERRLDGFNPKGSKAEKCVENIRNVINAIRETTLRLNRSIAREVGENVIAYQRHRRLRVLQFVVQNGAGALGLESRQLVERRDRVVQILERLWSERRGRKSTDQKKLARLFLSRHDAIGPSGDENPHGLRLPRAMVKLIREALGYELGDSGDPCDTPGAVDMGGRPSVESWPEWIDSCNELGTLGIATRSFEYAKESFERVLEEFGALEFLKSEKSVHEQRAAIQLWIDQELPESCAREREGGPSRAEEYEDGPSVADESSALADVLLGIVGALQRLQQVSLAQGYACHTISRRRRTRDQASAHFAYARKCCELGLELQKHANREGVEGESGKRPGRLRENIHRMYDDRQRICTQDAIAHAYRGDFERAHARLNEALASLSEVTTNWGALEYAIIELHRTEVFTYQAAYESGTAKRRGKDTLLSRRRREVLGLAYGPDKVTLASLCGRIDELRGDNVADELRQSRAFVNDAWQALCRAERTLTRNRKNVWWTTWFFELRLKLCELDIWMALIQADGVPNDAVGLPHLSLEAAAYDTPTLPDRLADDADRMVRLDLYRMGRVVESYANCLLGLALWREGRRQAVDGEDWKRLGKRQERMMEKCRDLGCSLLRRINRRDELDYTQFNSTKIDKYVNEYVEFLVAVRVRSKDDPARDSRPPTDAKELPTHSRLQRLVDLVRTGLRIE